METGERSPSKATSQASHSHESNLLLCCEDLVIGYGGKALLPPINLQVRRGSFLAVIGRNGSGKSTWFRTLLGLQAPVSGRVFRSGPHVKSAYVPQISGIDGLLPVRSRELVHWGRLSGWNFLRPFSKREDRDAVELALQTASCPRARSSAPCWRGCWPPRRTWCCWTSPPRPWTPWPSGRR